MRVGLEGKLVGRWVTVVVAEQALDLVLEGAADVDSRSKVTRWFITHVPPVGK